METDKTTLNDLSIFNHEEEFSIFHKLNFTRTVGGQEKLKNIFNKSLSDRASIQNVQKTLQLFINNKEKWPVMISNGSVLMIHKFYESIVDQIPARPTVSTAYFYKIFHAPDYSLIKYSTEHAFDFLKGLQQITENFLNADTPDNLRILLEKIKVRMDKQLLKNFLLKKNFGKLTMAELLGFAHFIRYHFKQNFLDLIEMYYQMDAWYGMAMAVKEFDLIFPEFSQSEEPQLVATGLYHILLPLPVAYNVELNPRHNFIFLTGANMAGKSTYIKAVGAAVFLAHTGMGVPAKSMQLSVFDGLLSNINVVDNVVKGESYFYNEVQRIKNTILKINDGRKWLILIDELFKGTNIKDAMKCSTVVIEGLIKIKSTLFILSTHLYEIGEELKNYTNIDFKYFETIVSNDQLIFNYNLKDGISNDRLGYLILKREKVLELLDKL
ncbi:MAG TPA: DNA mismatch repair protein MutS [Chitinophagaceae bacterium]|nr:DNA mismatch repair protein MutS [Chitinophagaceae bacterium]